jgi:hypothetical protein
VPLAFLVLLGTGRSFADWFSARPAPPLTETRAARIGWILRVTTALLLIGHGGFDVAMHKDWSSYPAAIGISPATLAAHSLRAVGGWFECALGMLVLAWPTHALLLFVFVWKVGRAGTGRRYPSTMICTISRLDDLYDLSARSFVDLCGRVFVRGELERGCRAGADQGGTPLGRETYRCAQRRKDRTPPFAMRARLIQRRTRASFILGMVAERRNPEKGTP